MAISIKRLFAFLFGLSLIQACSPGPSESWVARWEGGELSAEQLDDYILSLGVKDRMIDADTPDLWWRQMVIAAATQSVLVERVDLQSIDFDADWELRRLRRETVVERSLEEFLEPVPGITEEQLTEAWEERSEQFQAGEQRQLLTIFKRFTGPASETRTIEEAEELRRRILAGESFGDLAATESDSETRHRRGLAGTYARDGLPKRVADIVFALDSSELSEVMVTKTGAHLFLVERVVPAREVSYEEARAELYDRLVEANVEERVRELADQCRELVQSDLLIDDPSKLKAALTGSPDQPILRIGDFEATPRDLDELEATSLGGLERYRRLADEELIYQSSDGLVLDLKAETLLKEQARKILIERELDRLLRESVDTVELEAYWATNARRFGIGQQLQIKVLEIPLGSSPVDEMMKIEASVAELNAGRISLGELTERFDAKAFDMGWLTMEQIRRRFPMVPSASMSVEPGQCGPPFRTGASITLLQLIDRRNEVAVDLEGTRERVLESFVREQSQQLKLRAMEHLMAQRGLEVNELWAEERASAASSS